MGSLFSGSGGFELAASLCGITPVWASEIEPYPIAVTRSRFPEMKHLGSVTSVCGREIDPVDVVSFGSPCFPAGTLVLTDEGYVPIEEVTVGMKVLTHIGRWRKVTAVGSNIGETIILKGNHYGLECTPNHPIYSADVIRRYPRSCDGSRSIVRIVGGEKRWTPAEEMEGRLWCVPLKTEYLPIKVPSDVCSMRHKPMPEMNNDFFYFVGRWLGDGWIRNTQRSGRPVGQRWWQIVLCDSLDKEGDLRSIVEKLGTRYGVERCRTVVKVKFYSQVLCEWLKENFGEYAHGKKIPSWVYSLPRDKQGALMQGLLDSDGYRSGENTWKISSVSKRLIHGTRIIAEMLGYSTTVYHNKTSETCIIEGRTVKQRDIYTLSIVKSNVVEHLTDDLHGWYKVRKVFSTNEVKTVYNITVDEDNSYVADGIVVHNCQDMSIAGKRAGLKHADNGDEETTRSGLFIEAIRIIKEMREATNGRYPRFVLWENVLGAFNSNKGEDFRIVLEEFVKISEPHAVMPSVPNGGWPNADNYCGDGWSLAYRVFDAQYWGVPQRRRRIYLVLDLGGDCARKVLFEREGVRRDSEKSRAAWKKFTGRDDDSAGEDDSRKCRIVYSFDARGNGDGDIVSTITGDHENRITDYTSCLIETDPTYCMATGQANAEILKEQSPCLNYDHEQPIVFPRDRISYSIRRLTPMECARLQGCPDDWGVPDSKDVLTDDEYAFWSDVRKTHAKINGKPIKNYTKEQMLSWYKKLHTDMSEYKMWGNGIALPCALYCMQGILDCLEDGYGEVS